MPTMPIIPENWQRVLHKSTIEKANACMAAVEQEREAGGTIYPPTEKVYRALELTAPEDVKVIILGQDPYHGPNEANGLAFSVTEGVKCPPSLKNIFKELEDVMGVTHESTELDDWARQGVLLLNSGLTVREHAPGSHKCIGWHSVTRDILATCFGMKQPMVAILWGNHAVEVASSTGEAMLHRVRPIALGSTVWAGEVTHDNGVAHAILMGPHPSPLSAYRGFFGSKPFRWANDELIKAGGTPIKW